MKYLKQILTGLGIIAIFFSYIAFDYQAEAANQQQFAPDLYPITNSRYYLGTSTKAWLEVTSDSYCLTGDSCISSWPTGGGGGAGGGWSTSTPNIISTNWASATNALVGINSSSPKGILVVKGISGTTTPVLLVTSSTNSTLLRVDGNGTTTIASLGAGTVQSTSGGSLYVTANTGTGLNVLQTSPTLVTPILGVASGTALTLSGNLWVSGQTNLGNASSTSLTVSGLGYLASTTITGTLNVSGSTTISSLGTGLVRSSSGSLYTDATTYLSSIGSGNPGFVSIWNGTNALTQGIIRDNGTVAGINATSSTINFNIQGTGTLDPFNVASSTGSPILRVTTAGRVGIGTATPVTALEVVGTIQGEQLNLETDSETYINFGYQGVNGQYIKGGFGNTFTIYDDISNEDIIRQDEADIFTDKNWTLNTGNNLSVGGTLLVIATTTLTSATTTINGLNYYWPASVSGTKILQNDGNGNLSWVADQTGGGGSLSGGTTGFAAIWASSTAVTIGTLRDNGTVAGVNATSSTVTFNIQGTGTLNPFNVSSSTGDSIFQVGVNSRVGINTTTPEATVTVQGITTSPNVEPFVIASSSGQQLLVVLPSGNVGIGSNISNPFTRLQVGNSNEVTATPSQLFFGEYSTSSGWPTFLGNWASTGLWAFGPDSGSANSVLRVGVTPGNSQGWSVNQSAFKVAIGDSIFGNSVGVGTTSPVATLTVMGTSTAPTINPFLVASSSGSTLFRVANNGSTTLSSLGTGCVGVSSGSLYTTSCGGAGTIDGSGAPGLVTTWSDADTLTTGLLRDNGTVAGVNATSSSILFNIQGTSGSTNNIFNIASSTGISIFTATANQRVGIGSSTPVSTLVVQGTSTYPTISPLTVASSSGASLFVVTNAGKVGVGSNTPTSLFTVDNNTTNATTTLFIESLGTKGTCVVIKDADGSGYTYVSANNGALLIGTGSCE